MTCSVIVINVDICIHYYLYFFFFNDTATTEIYTLSLHDALPISNPTATNRLFRNARSTRRWSPTRSSEPSAGWSPKASMPRSEEHTSELQSLAYLVCRLLLEKKKVTYVKYVSHNNATDRASCTIR